MTPRERIHAVFSGGRPDRTPVAETLHHGPLMDRVSDRGATPDQRARQAISRLLDATREGALLGQTRPPCRRRGWTLYEERWSAWATPPSPGPREHPAAWLRESWARDFDPLADLDAQLRELRQEAEQLAPTTLWTTLAAPDFYPGSRHTHGPVGLGAAVTLFGLDGVVYLDMDEPALLSGFLERYTQASLARIAALPAQLPTRVFFVGEDLAHQGGPLFPLDFLEREFFPRLAAIVAAIHARGDFVLCHSDGDLSLLLPRLLDCGIDGLHPIDVDAGMTVHGLRREYPGLVLAGGIDCNRLLSRGTPEEIGDAVLRIVEAGGERYLAGTSGELHEAIPLENALALFAALGRITEDGGQAGAALGL